MMNMKQKLHYFIFSLLLLSHFSSVSGQTGYSLKINAHGAAGKQLRLAYHLGNKQYIKDSLLVEKTGVCSFRGSERLPQGVYMIVFPGNVFFEFLAGEDQYFDISCDIIDPAGTLSFTGSEENRRFLEYQKQWKLLQEQATAISENLRVAPPAGSEAALLKKQLNDQENRMKQYLHETADNNQGTLLGAIARSIIPVEPHIEEVPIGVAGRDSIIRLRSYINYKEHFFDNIDFSQPGLIRSPVLEGKLEQFFGQVVVQLPDSIIKEADRVLAKSEIQKEMFQYVAVWLFNRYAASEYMGHDAVVVHLAETVYLSGKAPWVSEEYLTDLAKRVDRLRPSLIGKRAPEMVMSSFAGPYVSLYDVEADFTIIYFWEPDCGHCKESTPLLKKFYNENRDKSIEVFAVCTQSDKEKWEKYIVENGLVWINGWDPQRLSRFDLNYNVEATPMIYILDRSKTIIAKRLSVQDIGPFIDNYRKLQKQLHSSSGK
jgi:thiol-disulfide isomerase/thioredoxin